MTHEKIREDAQEIRRRLSELGENLDEDAICDLLQSFDPHYKLEHIINLITENWSSDCQNNEAETSTINLTSIIKESKVQHDNDKIFKFESVQEEYNEISDASSDYDDRDVYYASTNLDDISVIDTVTRSIPSPLKPCDNVSSSNYNGEATNFSEVTGDLENLRRCPEEFLEENNNDPNNNLGSVLIFPEFENNSPDIDHERKDSNVESFVEFFEKPESPKPGCSKDSHDTFLSPKLSRLHTEAEQINVLLPKLSHHIIYKTLWHNYNAKNRIELTLWDLLPERRPKPQVPSKRKLLDDTYSMECKKNIADISKDDLKVVDNRLEKLQSVSKKDSHIEEHTIDEIMIEDDTITDTSHQDTVSTAKIKLSKMNKSNNDIDICNVSDKEKSISSKVDTENKELQLAKDAPILYETVEGEIEEINHSKSILRPSKLTYIPNNKYTTFKSSSLQTAILSPPKFKIPKDRKQTTTRFVMVPIQNPKKSTELRQNTEGHAPLDTSADRRNIQASDVNITQLDSSIDLKEDDATTSQDKTVPNIKTESAKLSKNNTSHDLQSNNTENIPTLNIVKDVNSKSKVKNLRQEGIDVNTTQVMASTNEEVNATKRLEVLNSLQPCNTKQSQASDMLNQTIAWHTVNHSLAPYNHTMVYEKASTSTEIVDKVEETGYAMKKKQGNTEHNISDKKITLGENARKIYYKLIPMFPCVNTQYIKQLCQEYIKDDLLVIDEINLLQILVEHLLNNSLILEKHPNVKKPEPAPDTFDVNEQYANLLEIFPAADPIFLRQTAEKIYNNPDMIKQFVQSQLEKPDYPTREQYLAKKKITEQQKQYTTGFQVSQFLEIFPDPFSHFENDKRECKFDIHAVDFLKHHFNKIRVNTLLNIYSQCKHNLSLTAKVLERLNPDMKTKRVYALVQTENIPLLQECAFILHKTELQAYFNELKEKEEKEFNELKAKNELFECQCCYDNECMPSKCSTCEDGHIFCNSCVAKCTDVKLAEGETHIYCLIDCGSEFHLSVLQHVLLPTKFSILLQKRQEAEVMAAGLEGLVSCPFCHFASIPPQEDKVFKCFNPDCMKESCRLCKEINHLPLKCNEVKSDAARLYLEEKMTEALIRKCPNCSRTFFKEEGCNKMTCLCGTQMCYICDKKISSYGHFKGQGSMAPDLCPLWSDDRRMNAEAVIHVCKETMKQIKEKNPEIKINTDVLLPKLPPKTRGPHDDIAHANILPAHANRVARHIP
ncbi:uncharacterized protein LOC105181804 [Harpegnathos saltator]|uniref:E3 ubiquitin-protein ligase RNF216 n=1 Tax=Harpegnathos saltator TaxID=610380 RepID=E2BE53_HARSA|nr:uncharacterized protein LOC105181804 [Harpegnathos saltator]XP_019696310.1 uncharacterized protein LOC105181804 [Harpegnathos saltator]EFN86040.1 E3 ubiquitin-protein ligase RNF216 [Harpegnathos saltator]